MENNAITIFLSYSWKDSELATTIDDELQTNGFNVKRDIRDIGTWKSIKEFMSSIRNQDYALIIISSNYLKSSNCMYEITEVLKDKNYKDKLLSIVTEDANIYNPISKAGYIKFWESESKELENAIKPIKPENSVELAITLRQYRSIESNIASFLDLVSDKNNPQIHHAIEKVVELIKTKNKIKENTDKTDLCQDLTITLQACHYAHLKFAALQDVSGTEIEKMIGIKKITDKNDIDTFDLPMLTCEIKNTSNRVINVKEPLINGHLKLNDDYITGLGFMIKPSEEKHLLPGDKVTFSLYGKIMISLIKAMFDNAINEIFIEDNFGNKYYVPKNQIHNAINYFKHYCNDFDELENRFDKYSL